MVYTALVAAILLFLHFSCKETDTENNAIKMNQEGIDFMNAGKYELALKSFLKAIKSTKLSKMSVEALNDINEKITDVSIYTENIVKAGLKQNQDILSVNKSMESISIITTENASNIEQTSQAAIKLLEPSMKIGRPRQLYTGETMRDYVDVEER